MNVLVDTGVWYAFCDPRERSEERDSVDGLFESLQFMNVMITWPVLYETIRTRLSKNPIALSRLEMILKKPNLVFIDDTSYREDALQMVFDLSVKRKPPRPLSMVDRLLRLILDDSGLKIDKFVTYNDKDFHDVCRNRTIEMVK